MTPWYSRTRELLTSSNPDCKGSDLAGDPACNAVVVGRSQKEVMAATHIKDAARNPVHKRPGSQLRRWLDHVASKSITYSTVETFLEYCFGPCLHTYITIGDAAGNSRAWGRSHTNGGPIFDPSCC